MLPNDIARCNGQTDARDRLCDLCIGCERRTAPRSDRQPFTNGRMEPSGTYCQDRLPPQYPWVPGWLVKP